MDDYRVVLDYWFGEGDDIKRIIQTHSHLWWSKDETVDREIAGLFSGLLGKVEIHAIDHWADQSLSRLALIIITDQFSRNIHRDSPKAFALDPFALSLTAEGIRQGMDQELNPVQRVFFYLPLEHSEAIEIQIESVKQFRQLVEEVPASLKDTFHRYHEFAIRHWNIIQRFGRFPHRNAILGRESTAEEIEFLKSPGSAF